MKERFAISPDDRQRIIWPLAALALLLLFNLLFTDGFFHITLRDGHLYGSVIDIVVRAAPLILVTIGMTLVIATGGVDLSVGAIMAMSGTVAAGIVAKPEYSILSNVPISGPVAAIIAAILIAALAGAVNGSLVAFFGVQPIIATLVLMVSGRGVAQLLAGGQVITFRDAVLEYAGSGWIFGLPAAVFIAFGSIVIAIAIVRGTALGILMEAIGANRSASRIAGLPTKQIPFLAYVISGVTSGLAGVLIASDLAAADANRAGLYIELDAILAVVLGGTALIGGRFSLVGALVGALLIQSVNTTILTRGVTPEYTLIVKSAIVIIVVLLQSRTFRSMIVHHLPRAGDAAA